MKTAEEIMFSIESRHTYTEWSKYQQLSYEELEIAFKYRFLDYDAHYKYASDESFTCGLGTVSPSDILVEVLQTYDDSIRGFFYQEKRKGLVPKEIFKNFLEKEKDKSLYNSVNLFKFKSNDK